MNVECTSLMDKLKKARRDLTYVASSGAVHNYLYDVWEVGRDTAKCYYDQALTKEGAPANEHTTVNPVPTFTNKGCELIASGEDILFLEFGTGIFQDYTNPYADQFGFYPGSFSFHNKRFLFPPKYNHFRGRWPHGGTLHAGQNPARGMYNAYKEMELYVRTTPLRLFT